MITIIGLTIHDCTMLKAEDDGFWVTLDTGYTTKVHKVFDDSRRTELQTFLINTNNKFNSMLEDVDRL